MPGFLLGFESCQRSFLSSLAGPITAALSLLLTQCGTGNFFLKSKLWLKIVLLVEKTTAAWRGQIRLGRLFGMGL